MYNPAFLTDIQKINKLTKESDPTAITDFVLWLESIKDIGAFSNASWPIVFRSEVYILGKNFTDIDPGEFFRKIRGRL